ncbi:MAG: VWA-like domain-containing protein [Candidatus Thermoplasmatota archaeon]|nr:VWA-like domain-containing protein [Candidatus Thermoplasmatota archaeon]
MEPKRKIKRARVQLLLDSPFFGNLAMNLKIVEVPNMEMPTMAVDFKGNVYYDPKFVNDLNIEELKFVLCHEVLHLGFQHITRREGRVEGKWFKACDYAVNSTLKMANVGTMPTGKHEGLYDSKFDDWSADRIYKDLPDEKKKGGGSGAGQSQQGNVPGMGKCTSGGGFDQHAPPTSSGGSQGSPKGKNGQQPRTATDTEIKEMEDNWKVAVARAATSARMQGKLPGGLEQLIEDILYPKVDWRTVLWQFVNKVTKDDYRWYPPNRRHVCNGFYLPSMRSESFEIAVAIDTSGSISDEELSQFLGELTAILEMNPSCTVHFFECGAQVNGYHEYRAGDPIECKMHGRGGTSFTPVFEDVEKRSLDISCLCYLTDGYGDHPEYAPGYPVLWIMTTDVTLGWGEHIRMED